MLNETTGAVFLKTLYSPTKIENMVAKKASPILGRIKKLTDGGGDHYQFISPIDDIATGSADFTKAQSLAASTSTALGIKYTLDWCSSYEPVRLTGRIIALTKNTNAAWMQALKQSMDSAIRVATHRMSIRLYTQGWGELCTVKAGSVSGKTFKCTVPEHVTRFLKGMRLVGSSSLNAAVLRSATYITVEGVDYGNNTITCDINLSTPGIVAGDTIFLDGDREDSATPTRLCPAGLPAWIPYQPVTDGTLSTFFSAVRSTNTRSYGNYLDGTNMSLVDSLKQIAQSP